MICFGILRIFGEKSQKRKTRKFGHFRPLRCGEVGVPKWHPTGTSQCSSATPRRSYYSQEPFLEFCSESLVFVHR